MSTSELIPVRILNQSTYCPRLGYLQWVQKEWADNEFTTEGTWVHRRVDGREGYLPTPEEAEHLPFRSRSVDLSAPCVGLVGKLDLVELGGGEAVPVEYKRGRPPKGGELAHPWDLVQLGAQALLLEENGWRVTRGFFFYAESREKVEIEWDEQLRGAVLKAIEDVRLAVSRQVPPAPLQHSPKCSDCSLNAICLPDETLLLQHATSPDKVRLLLAPANEALPMYFQTNGVSIGISGEIMEVREKGKTIGEVRLIDTSQVCLFGNIQISTQCVRELAFRNIPICYFTYGGWFTAITTGLAHKNVELRQAQYRAAFDPERTLALARRLVSAKIRNSRTFLRRNARTVDEPTLAELKRLAGTAEKAGRLESLLGIEGMAARIYFGALPKAIKNEDFLKGADFDYTGRNRRPPRDPLNALLSFLYGLLVKELTVTAQAVGFDPYQGFYHQPRYGKPSLALDLMEEFRVLVADSTALTLVNNNVVSVGDFVRVGGGISMNRAAMKRVIKAFEQRMGEMITHPWFGYRLTYRRVLYVQTRLLARHLAGEITDFPPFLTR